MEAASLALAVTGMFKTCIQGYRIISDSRNAPRDAQDAARRIGIEKAVFSAWGNHFEVNDRPPKENDKLKHYLERGETFDGVFLALCAISETFIDVQRMDKRYGIRFDYAKQDTEKRAIPQDVEALLNGRDPSQEGNSKKNLKADAKRRSEHFKKKMSLLGKCKWSLTGKSRVQNLISDLREYNEDLVRLCTWDAQTQINRGIPGLAVLQYNNYVFLFSIASAAEDSAKANSSSFCAEGRQGIANMARFKARLKTPTSVSDKFGSRKYELDATGFKTFPNTSDEQKLTIGINSANRTFVLIEWRSHARSVLRSTIRELRGTLDKHTIELLAEEQTHSLVKFLCTPNRPVEFRVLQCLGLFEDEENSRKAVVYQVPEHLRDLPPVYSEKDLTDRMPSSLTDLFKRIPVILDLGHRFNAARKLMASVIAMHTCGWLHKNIRSENIYFFPAKQANGRIERYRKDFGHPYIMGHKVSRPDDVCDEAPTKKKGDKKPGDLPLSLSINPDPIEEIDIYTHPAKVSDKSKRYRHGFDVYSLGIVLLELGLWKSLSGTRLSSESTPFDYRDHLLKTYMPLLTGQCGSIYAGVVEECLKLRYDDAEMERESQRKLCWDISERLDRCVA